MSGKWLILEIGEKYGVNAALVLQHVRGWVRYNAKHGKNLKEGKYWMYQTSKDMSKELKCLTKKQVEDAVRRLVGEGLLIKGNYNKKRYDKTSWYTLSDTGWALVAQYGNMDDPVRDHPCYQEATPIPKYNTNNIKNQDSDIDDDDDVETNKSGSHEVVYYQQFPVLKSEISQIEQLLTEIWEKHYPVNTKYTQYDVSKAVQYVTAPHTFGNGDYAAIYCPPKADMLKLAFTVAHDNNCLNWAYIDNVLYNWERLEIKNYDDYRKHETERYRENH